MVYHVVRALLRRATGLFRSRAPQPSPSSADIDHLQARLRRQTASGAEARQTIASLEQRLHETRTRLDERRHSALSPDVLAHLLPLKAQHRPALPEDAQAAAAREQRLLGASPEYHQASTGAPDPEQLQRISIGGLPWWVPLDDRSPDRLERAAAQGFPFRAILQTREVSLGGIMLDLGANIGRTSIPRVLLGDVRAVYAAEPEPNNYACLVQNVREHRLQGYVMPDRVAIGGRRGEIALRQSKYAGGHRVMHTGPGKADRLIAVRMIPLDEWLDTLGVDADAVSFVKVDTQGSEVQVLSGATRLLGRRQAAWQVEVDPGLLSGAGTDTATLLGLLQTHFTHFIDLAQTAPGPRVQETARMNEALGYLGTSVRKTDVIVFCAGAMNR